MDKGHECAADDQKGDGQDPRSVMVPELFPELFPEFIKRLWRGSDGLLPDRMPIHRGLSMERRENVNVT
jgi:glycine/D-amino acid oxidase-like deaminating enzyme